MRCWVKISRPGALGGNYTNLADNEVVYEYEHSTKDKQILAWVATNALAAAVSFREASVMYAAQALTLDIGPAAVTPWLDHFTAYAPVQSLISVEPNGGVAYANQASVQNYGWRHWAGLINVAVGQAAGVDLVVSQNVTEWQEA